MQLDHYPLQQLTRDILEIVGRQLDLNRHRVFFFGSRVSGRGTDRSDIDVGIDGPEPVPLRVLETIQEQLEALPTLYTIQVVDFQRVSPAFREVALQQTESLQ